MAEAGVPRHHISAVLNHVQAGPTATRVYDRYSYDAEKRAALETWAKELSRILAARPRTGRRFPAVRERQGAYPRHHRISANAVAWIEDDIAKWIQSTVAGIAV